jgi:hypothetical protein
MPAIATWRGKSSTQAVKTAATTHDLTDAASLLMCGLPEICGDGVGEASRFTRLLLCVAALPSGMHRKTTGLRVRLT